jgi:hypothetical protein
VDLGGGVAAAGGGGGGSSGTSWFIYRGTRDVHIYIYFI